MKALKYIFFLTVLFFGNTNIQAQIGKKSAGKEYDQWAYTDAITIYEKVVKRGHESEEVLAKLANAYYFNAKYAQAYKYYQQLFSKYQSNLDSEYYYRYAQTLQNVGKEDEAKVYYNLFVEKVGNQTQIAQNRKNIKDLEAQLKANSGRYSHVLNLPFNSKMADYGSYLHNSKLYFTSTRDTGNISKKQHTWTGKAFSSLFTVDNVNGDYKNVKRVKGEVKTLFNEASAVITKDGKTMYFTRNNYINNRRKVDKNGNTNLKIYKASLINGKWTDVVELPFNSNEFNSAHPALSADESTLYFSSDRPGGYGSTDLWQVCIYENAYSSPQNLGPHINTEARETFPFVSANNELYFSSDGRVGLGGLDIYAVGILNYNKYTEVQNLGSPINTQYDDFAYYINHETKNGYFSSNREGGKGDDDIYSFNETRSLVLQCDQDLKVKVINARTGEELKDAKVLLYDVYYQSPKLSNNYSIDGYRFVHDFSCGERYRLCVDVEDYETQEVNVSLPLYSGVTEKIVALEPIKIELKQGDDLFKALKLNPIYFDLDKSNIRMDAEVELAKILAVMEEYPNMIVDIRSHTDSRASAKYNENLSERRAKATRDWLISNGIAPNRLTAKGYGESQLINNCKDGVKCDDEQHQANRRSEFIIMQLN